MKKIITTITIFVSSVLCEAQVGLSSQYFPGLQLGAVTVNTGNPKFGKYKYAAGLPILMIDRMTNHWYTNIDMSALYYGVTQTNKANDNRIQISKGEGAVIAGRLGYVFGKGDQFRIGPNINFGSNTSNLDSSKATFIGNRNYYNVGLGVIAYQKLGKFRVIGKLGFERYSKKGYLTSGRGSYLEITVGRVIYQKYGLSIMPSFYAKKFGYIDKAGVATAAAPYTAKVRMFVIRFGLTKFF
jgi:hypothetical protein